MAARTLLMQMARRKLSCINSSGLPANLLYLIKLSSLLSAQADTHAGMCLFVGVGAFFCRHSDKHNSLAGFRSPAHLLPAQTRWGQMPTVASKTLALIRTR